MKCVYLGTGKSAKGVNIYLVAYVTLTTYTRQLHTEFDHCELSISAHSTAALNFSTRNHVHSPAAFKYPPSSPPLRLPSPILAPTLSLMPSFHSAWRLRGRQIRPRRPRSGRRRPPPQWRGWHQRVPRTNSERAAPPRKVGFGCRLRGLGLGGGSREREGGGGGVRGGGGGGGGGG